MRAPMLACVRPPPTCARACVYADAETRAARSTLAARACLHDRNLLFDLRPHTLLLDLLLVEDLDRNRLLGLRVDRELDLPEGPLPKGLTYLVPGVRERV